MVCGSRTITDKDWIFRQLDAYQYWELACYEELTMIQGCAKGVDELARQFAVENDWEHIEDYPAEWHKYGRSAGYIRNAAMVEMCDECLILWDGTSKGTKHDIDLCIKMNKLYRVLIYNDTTKEEFVDKYTGTFAVDGR